VQPGPGPDAGGILHEELAWLHRVDHRARHLGAIDEREAIPGMQVHRHVQHQPVPLEGAHLADELAQMFPGFHIAHGATFAIDAVGRQTPLEGLRGVRREGVTDRAKGGPAQLRTPLQKHVQLAAHLADDVLHVVRILEAPLDLEALDTSIREGFEMIGQIQVADVQEVLLPHQHLVGRVHQVPGGAAGLGTLAAVAAAVADGPAQVALAALPHA